MYFGRLIILSKQVALRNGLGSLGLDLINSDRVPIVSKRESRSKVVQGLDEYQTYLCKFFPPVFLKSRKIFLIFGNQYK